MVKIYENQEKKIYQKLINLFSNNFKEAEYIKKFENLNDKKKEDFILKIINKNNIKGIDYKLKKSILKYTLDEFQKNNDTDKIKKKIDMVIGCISVAYNASPPNLHEYTKHLEEIIYSFLKNPVSENHINEILNSGIKHFSDVFSKPDSFLKAMDLVLKNPNVFTDSKNIKELSKLLLNNIEILNKFNQFINNKSKILNNKDELILDILENFIKFKEINNENNLDESIELTLFNLQKYNGYLQRFIENFSGLDESQLKSDDEKNYDIQENDHLLKVFTYFFNNKNFSFNNEENINFLKDKFIKISKDGYSSLVDRYDSFIEKLDINNLNSIFETLLMTHPLDIELLIKDMKYDRYLKDKDFSDILNKFLNMDHSEKGYSALLEIEKSVQGKVSDSNKFNLDNIEERKSNKGIIL